MKTCKCICFLGGFYLPVSLYISLPTYISIPFFTYQYLSLPTYISIALPITFCPFIFQSALVLFWPMLKARQLYKTYFVVTIDHNSKTFCAEAHLPIWAVQKIWRFPLHKKSTLDAIKNVEMFNFFVFEINVWVWINLGFREQLHDELHSMPRPDHELLGHLKHDHLDAEAGMVAYNLRQVCSVHRFLLWK